MLDKGLANDMQVPVANQKLEGTIPSAADLPTLAVGHWGVIGANVPLIHGERHYRDFNPTLHTYAIRELARRMGL
jgi:hypothetical protein